MSEQEISTVKSAEKSFNSKDVVLFVYGTTLIILALFQLLNLFKEQKTHQQISMEVSSALAQQAQAFNRALAERDKIIQQQAKVLDKVITVYNKNFKNNSNEFNALNDRIDSIHIRQNESVNALNKTIEIYDASLDDIRDNLQFTDVRIGSLEDEFDFFTERAIPQMMEMDKIQSNINALNKFAGRIYKGPLGFLRIEDVPEK